MDSALCTLFGGIGMNGDYPEKNIAITGIGQSKVSRSADKSALGLTIDAAMEAIRDA